MNVKIPDCWKSPTGKYLSPPHINIFLCPSDEMIAAFIDRRLDRVEHLYVNEHLNYCPRCYELVSETRAVLQMAQRDKEAITQDA